VADALDHLFEAARAVREFAYAPYSHFAVGAALRTVDGRVFVGTNVENSAYPVGTCAEAGAIAAMIAGSGTRIDEIVVVAASETPIAPCGACRQRLREFMSDDGRVHAASLKGITTSWPITALLPHAFGPQHLDDANEGRVR
jgi:cytidine deaminase